LKRFLQQTKTKNLRLIKSEWSYARKIPLHKRFRFANVAFPSPCSSLISSYHGRAKIDRWKCERSLCALECAVSSLLLVMYAKYLNIRENPHVNFVSCKYIKIYTRHAIALSHASVTRRAARRVGPIRAGRVATYECTCTPTQMLLRYYRKNEQYPFFEIIAD